MSVIKASLLLLAVYIVTVVARNRGDPEPCQTPTKWEGHASEYDHLQGINNRFNISFDGENQMKRFIEQRKSFMPGKRWYEYIQDYKQKIQYQINWTYKTCTVDDMKTPWQNHTIPLNATLEDQYIIGDSSETFYASEWSDRVPYRKKEAWIGVFSEPTCWPLFEVYTYNDPNDEYSVSTSTRFYNMTEGIKDKSVFTPPDICNKPYEQLLQKRARGDEYFNMEYVDKIVDAFKNLFNLWSDWEY